MNAPTNIRRIPLSKRRSAPLVALIAALFAAFVLLLIAVERTDAQTTTTTGQQVWAWGVNLYGQLGNGTDVYASNTPVQVSNLSGVTDIAAGGDHSLALLPDTTAPTTTARATTADGSTYYSGEWTNQDVTLSLTAVDEQNGSGVDKIFYNTDGSTNYQEYSAPLSFTSEGTTTVHYHATDKAGNAEQPQTFTIKIDKTAPTVSSTSPLNKATGVSRATTVKATFVEQNMDATTLDHTTVQLFSGNSTKPLKASVSYDAGTSTVTLTPSSTLDAKTKYTANIQGGTSGVKDLAGNALAPDYTWTFTTGSQWK
jgi:hypothetical protein